MLARNSLLLGLVVTSLYAQAVSAIAQAHPDSLRAWAVQLEGGTLEQRAEAAGHLHASVPIGFPPLVQEVLIAELNRINDILVLGTGVPGAVELGGESFGEYYLDLTLTVASFDNPAATLALVRSIGVGGGIQRRVARQGDPVIGELANLVHQDYQPGEALETLALAWFWADSTGAPLSAESRAVIAREIVAATSSSNYSLLRSAADVLELIADPAFLPLAQGFRDRAQAADERLVAGALERGAIPRLYSVAADFSVLDLSSRIERAAAAVCAHASTGTKHEVCESSRRDLTAARAHLQSGRSGSARHVLEAVVIHAERALTEGVLEPAEADILAGGARMLLDRI